MATTPIFASTPKIGLLQLAAATTARDTIVPAAGNLLFTAGANGSRIEHVDVVSAALVGGGAPSVNVIRLWVYDGTNALLLREVEVPSLTPTAGAKGFQATVYFVSGLVLPNGYTLRATVHTYAGAQDKINVLAHGADY